MRTFIKGEQLAISKYKPRLEAITNYLLSSGITFFLGIHGLLFYAPIAVMVPIIIIANIQPKSIVTKNEIFKAGYITSAKSKKIKCLIKSSLAGILTGGSGSFIFFKIL